MTNAELITEARKLLEDYPNYQEYPGGPLLKYPHQDALMRVANALEAAEARVKELEAGEWEYGHAMVLCRGRYELALPQPSAHSKST